MATAFDKPIREAEDRGERSLARRIRAEKRMVLALVKEVLKQGHQISVHDGEEIALRRSTDRDAIMAAVFSTDEDNIVVEDGCGLTKGCFYLVYGNDGYDVVSDYSDNPYCNDIWKRVIRPLSDKIEAGR